MSKDTVFDATATQLLMQLTKTHHELEKHLVRISDGACHLLY